MRVHPRGAHSIPLPLGLTLVFHKTSCSELVSEGLGVVIIALSSQILDDGEVGMSSYISLYTLSVAGRLERFGDTYSDSNELLTALLFVREYKCYTS